MYNTRMYVWIVTTSGVIFLVPIEQDYENILTNWAQKAMGYTVSRVFCQYHIATQEHRPRMRSAYDGTMQEEL